MHDKLFILHADHRQNCSTSTVRMNGRFISCRSFASISAGVSALWGPLHGGANQAVLEMLEIHKMVRCECLWLKQKDKMIHSDGFGHRVYKILILVLKLLKKP
jgi:citrate synthase